MAVLWSPKTLESGGIALLLFHNGDNGGGGAFYKRIAGNFMVHEDRITALPEISEWFSIIFVIIFEVIVVE